MSMASITAPGCMGSMRSYFPMMCFICISNQVQSSTVLNLTTYCRSSVTEKMTMRGEGSHTIHDNLCHDCQMQILSAHPVEQRMSYKTMYDKLFLMNFSLGYHVFGKSLLKWWFPFLHLQCICTCLHFSDYMLSSVYYTKLLVRWNLLWMWCLWIEPVKL